jgi:hypothetical protein
VGDAVIPTVLELVLALYAAGVLLFALDIPREGTHPLTWIVVFLFAALWPFIVVLEFVDWVASHFDDDE